jgi:shikimate dehydrogenase
LGAIQINGLTRKFGIIGSPVKHSFSPAMHTNALQSIGLNAVYLPFSIQKEKLPDLLPSFELLGIEGFNITVPHKENIIPYLDQLSPAAQILGSVNTVIHTSNGWMGYSTDGNGFLRSLKHEDIPYQQKTILMIGAGGAAKAIAVALAQVGVKELIIVNRTQEKADSLATILKKAFPDLAIRTSLVDTDSFDLLINTTSVGMEDDRSPIEDYWIQKSDYITDIIYNPPKTTLLKKAEQFGKKTLNGLGMLLYQGVEAFEIWTGQPAPEALMRKTLLDSLHNIKSMEDNQDK